MKRISVSGSGCLDLSSKPKFYKYSSFHDGGAGFFCEEQFDVLMPVSKFIYCV